MFISSNLLALAAFVSAVYALPSTVPVLQTIPSNAVKVAHTGDTLYAYDKSGQLLGTIPAQQGLKAMSRRQTAGTCTNLSADDVQKLPGWNQISQYIINNWGDGWDTIDANPSDFPDMGAQLCTDSSPSVVTMNGDPQCSTQNQTTGGSIVGADGTASLSAMQGTSQQTTVTVTTQSALAVGATVSAQVSIPEIVQITASVTSTVTFTNTQSTATAFTNNDQTTSSISVANKAGMTCQLNFTTSNCQFTGTGSIEMLAQGWVWTYYGSKRQGHYKWASNIEAILTNDADRSTSISYTTSTSSNTNSEYQATCQ